VHIRMKMIQQHVIYILSLQSLLKNFILYIFFSPTTSSESRLHILETLLIFNFLYIRIYHTLKYIIHILVLVNQLVKVFKWIENRLEKLYI
jgi:hypothetical protein